MDNLPTIPPMGFFSLTASLPYHKDPSLRVLLSSLYLLPSSASLMGEESFAVVGGAWSEEALYFGIEVEGRKGSVQFPEYVEGDSVELFIDTKCRRDAATTHQFSHHFVALPSPVQGVSGMEVTRFRTADRHSLASGEDFTVESKTSKERYQMKVSLPKRVLHGYTPPSLDDGKGTLVGFTYKINKGKTGQQHFALSSGAYHVEKYPSLWAEMELLPKGKQKKFTGG